MQLLIRFPLHSSYTSTYIATITYLSFGGRERFVEITELLSPDVAERKRGVKQRGPWRSALKSCAKIYHREVLDNTTYCLGPTANIRLESVAKKMKLSCIATQSVHIYWWPTGTIHLMKGTWNEPRDACFGPAWQSSGAHNLNKNAN